VAERTIRSLDKALQLLDALRVAGRPVGLKALSQQTGINPATAHLLLRTLAVHSYVEQDPVGRAYTLGMAIIDAGQRGRLRVSLATVVEPYARHVHRVSAESVFVRVIRGGQVYSLLEFESPQAVIVRPNQVQRSELRFGYAFASGKVFLAAMKPRPLSKLLGAPPYRALTDHTLTEPDDIARELDRVSQRGFATDRDEFMPGVSCVAVPLHDATGQVAAIMSIAMPSARATDDHISELAKLLTDAGNAASAQLQKVGVVGSATDMAAAADHTPIAIPSAAQRARTRAGT
jgi:IclR family acetate operon transcriptional repressor